MPIASDPAGPLTLRRKLQNDKKIEIDMDKVRSFTITPREGHRITVLQRGQDLSESQELTPGKPVVPFSKPLRVTRTGRNVAFASDAGEGVPVTREYATTAKPVKFSCSKDNLPVPCLQAVESICQD